MDRNDLIQINDKLKNNLSKKRYQHSIGVAYTSACLAMCYGVDPFKAELAGLIHDCAKEKYNDTPVMHAFKAPEVAKSEYGIDDPEVLSAIEFHTTGKADMNNLEKIVYIADYIEPNRKNLPIMSLAREWAFKDLTYTVYIITESIIEYLKKGNKVIERHTLECYEFLKENGIHDNN